MGVSCQFYDDKLDLTSEEADEFILDTPGPFGPLERSRDGFAKHLIVLNQDGVAQKSGFRDQARVR